MGREDCKIILGFIACMENMYLSNNHMVDDKVIAVARDLQ